MLTLLLESALRASLLMFILWLVFKVPRLRNPHIELTAWTLMLLVALAMPVLLRVSPITVPLPQAFPSASVERVPDMPTLPSITARPALRADIAQTVPPVVAPELSAAQSGAAHLRSLALPLYLAVAGFLLARLLLACVQAARLWRGATPLKISENMNVRITSAVTMPATVGATVLVPQGFPHWSSEKRAAVLAHERNHVARGDFYIQLLASLHCAVFWFNPAAWWLKRRLGALLESTSDDVAIAALGDRATYAEILLDVARAAKGAFVGIAMARPSTVSWRIERILAPGYVPGITARWKYIATTAAISPLVVVLTGAFAGAPSSPLRNDPPSIALDVSPPRSVFAAITPPAPDIPKAVAVSYQSHVDMIPVTPAQTVAVVADARPISSIPFHHAPSAESTPLAMPVAVETSVSQTAPVCIEDTREVDHAVIIDPNTILMEMAGGDYFRVDVINNPLDTDDSESHRPLALCTQDKLVPLGLESGLSTVARIRGIDAEEVARLRARDPRNIRNVTGPENRTNFLGAGRIGRLCNDRRLTVVQVDQCVSMMQAAETTEERSAVKQVVRDTIKRRQALYNRLNHTFAPTDLRGPLNWGMNPNLPPLSAPPPR